MCGEDPTSFEIVDLAVGLSSRSGRRRMCRGLIARSLRTTSALGEKTVVPDFASSKTRTTSALWEKTLPAGTRGAFTSDYLRARGEDLEPGSEVKPGQGLPLRMWRRRDERRPSLAPRRTTSACIEKTERGHGSQRFP